LTDILNPLTENGQSFTQHSFDFKKTLNILNVDKKDIQASFDVVALYPSIPIKKALECVREKLQKDETLSSRTDWKPVDIVKLLEICLKHISKQLMEEYLPKLMERKLESQSLDPSQIFT
jgi:hypothetical protein